MTETGRGPLGRLADIWTAFLNNELDDEARMWHGPDESRTYSAVSPAVIQIYAGRGGRELLTLEDCRQAWYCERGQLPPPPEPPRVCLHAWQLEPGTDGIEMSCSRCGAHAPTPPAELAALRKGARVRE